MTPPVAARLDAVRRSLPAGVELVAVSKFHPVEALRQAYEAGQRVFGESRAQELRAKASQLPEDVQWHFIGHLQRGNVKYVVPHVALIHAVDSLPLLLEIEKQAVRVGRVVPCLLQLHVADEATKYGFMPDELRQFLADGAWRACTHVRLRGLMCMATNTDDARQVSGEFRRAYLLYQEMRERWFADDPLFNLRSWGMSHDYPLAVSEGSNMVRIGTAIFGTRPQPGEQEKAMQDAT